MEELPFECDLTKAIRPGERNHLAIRITNPGGRLDWVDNVRMSWGGIEFQKSHGFGGVDRGMVLSAHEDVRFTDLWALNAAVPNQITAHAVLESAGAALSRGTVRFSVVDTRDGAVLARTMVSASTGSEKTNEVKATLTAPEAELWDLATPHVYRLEAEWLTGSGKSLALREVDCGFRWIAAEGIGTKALFRLNGDEFESIRPSRGATGR